MLKSFFIVALGSGIGGTLRYAISLVFKRWGEASFPVGTFIINVLGCFFIGLLYAYFKNREPDPHLILLLMTGILGGFTTFSTFSLETLQLLHHNELLKAIFYVVGSVGLGILACFLGYTFANK
ncbi:putative fluoride ion transporter CrcB [Capnocytophaga sp. HP1101]